MSDIIELEQRIAALESIVSKRPIESENLYSPSQVADRLGCSKTNVYDLIGSGELAFTRIGASKKGFKIMGSDLQAFLESRKEGGPKPKMNYKRLGL